MEDEPAKKKTFKNMGKAGEGGGMDKD